MECALHALRVAFIPPFDVVERRLLDRSVVVRLCLRGREQYGRHEEGEECSIDICVHGLCVVCARAM